MFTLLRLFAVGDVNKKMEQSPYSVHERGLKDEDWQKWFRKRVDG